jgi:hypothetical protein
LADFILVILAIVFSIVFVNAAFADEAEDDEEDPKYKPCEETMVGPKRKSLSWDDVPGIWFRRDISRCILRDLKTLPLMYQRNELLDRQLELKVEQFDIQNKAMNTAIQESEIASGNLERAIANSRKLEEELNHWTRSKLLWFGVGAVTILGSFFVFSQIKG